MFLSNLEKVSVFGITLDVCFYPTEETVRQLQGLNTNGDVISNILWRLVRNYGEWSVSYDPVAASFLFNSKIVISMKTEHVKISTDPKNEGKLSRDQKAYPIHVGDSLNNALYLQFVEESIEGSLK